MGNELAKRVDETYKNEVMASWDKQIPFVKDVSATQKLTKVEVKTGVEFYRYLTRGTDKKDYPIPLTPGFLRYQVDFTPKTTVGSLRSTPGGKSGPYITKTQVTHPGVEAREYEKLIIEEQTPWIVEYFTDILRSSIKVSND